MGHKKALRVTSQIFIGLCIVLQANTAFTTVWSPVDEQLIGSWQVRYDKSPLHHYVVPLTITFIERGMIPRAQGFDLLSETWVHDDHVLFRWIRKMDHESKYHQMLWNHVFEGHLEKLADGSVELRGTVPGTERTIECKPHSPLDDCLRIKVTGPWTAKKAKG